MSICTTDYLFICAQADISAWLDFVDLRGGEEWGYEGGTCTGVCFLARC